MFSVEFLSDLPRGAAPYYTLVVRDPYIVGSYHSCDIPLHVAGIPDQHVALVVMRESQANRIADGIEEGEAEAAHIDYVRSHVTQLIETPATRDAAGRCVVREDDPLVVFLTVLPPQDEQDTAAAALTEQCCVRVGDVVVPAGSGTIVYDKSEVVIGDDVALIFHYRPLVVSLQAEDFSLDEISDLLYIYLQLGATVCPLRGGPASDLSALPKPIGLLHAAETLRNTANSLVALAAGYSVVRTSYVPEWFAVVAQSAASPLSVLPPPSRFAVPLHHDASHMGDSASVRLTGFYLRPETDNCPFSLHPIPSSALRTRQRSALFASKHFLLYSAEAAAQYEAAICAAGGTCYVHPDRTAEARKVVVAASQAAASDAPALYIILGTDAELQASVNADEVANELSDLFQFLRGNASQTPSQAPLVDILPGAAVFDALLRNEFGPAPTEAHGRASADGSRDVSATTAVSPSMPAASSTTPRRGAYTVQPHEPIQSRGAAPFDENDYREGRARYQAPYGDAFSEERAPQDDGNDVGGEAAVHSGVAPTAHETADTDVMSEPYATSDANAVEASATRTGAQGVGEVEQKTAVSRVAPLKLNNLAEAAAGQPRRSGGTYTEGRPSESRSARGRRHRSSLLPRDANRTPSRSQMRSLMRARASSVNSANGSGGDEFTGDAACPASERRESMVSTATNGTRGRRRLVNIVNEKPEAFTDRFDAVRLRIYAFLTKEEPELDKRLVTMQRNRFVDDNVMEHTLEVKAQAQDFMEMTDDLLMESTGPYTDALRRYWSDCADLDAKAQRLLAGHRRQSNPASYHRPSFLADEDEESMPNRGAAPMPHARSPRQGASGSVSTPRGTGGVPIGEGLRRSMASLTPRDGPVSRTMTPRGARREGYQSIAHNRVEDPHIDPAEVAPLTEPALLPPTPRTAAVQQRTYGAGPAQGVHSGSSAPLTVTTRRRTTSPPTGCAADPVVASANAAPAPASTIAASDRLSVPPVDIASAEGSQGRQGPSTRGRHADDSRAHSQNGRDSALSRQYRPSTPRQRTIGLEAPMRVRARSSSARRQTSDRPAPDVKLIMQIQRAPAPMTAERNGKPAARAPSKSRKRSKTPTSRSGTPRGRYTPRPMSTPHPAWQY